MKATLLFVCMMAVAATATAQQYKWVDKDGKLRYGDTPPPGVKATLLRPPTGPSLPTAPAAKKGGEKGLSPEAAFRKRQQEAKEKDEKAGKEHAEAETKRANCEGAQVTLRQLQSGVRMSTMNAAGERVFIEDEQRAKEMERAQRAVSEWCK